MTIAAPIQAGSLVTLHYTLVLRDGEMVDTSRDGAPVTIKIGVGDWAEFLEKHLLGLSIGDKRHVEVNAQDSLSAQRDEDVQHLQRSDFPTEMQLEPGRVFAFSLPNGQEVAGQILGANGEAVTVDFGSPLAGRDLVLDVEILGVEPGTDQNSK